MKSGPRSIALLSALYFVQGMPFGFQATALKAYLRANGASLTAVGFASLLSTPWLLKALWAPIVDRTGSPRFGRRKSWIVPLQALLGLTCLGAGLIRPETHLSALLGLVLLMNFFAATQDIAVDGLAVDLLGERDLGLGNTAQVVGYKVGMLTGGGLLVWAAGEVGWPGLFWGMAALCFAVMGLTLVFRENDAQVSEGSHQGAPKTPPTFREVAQRLWAASKSPGTGWLLAFVASYKLGESLADNMYTPFLIDQGNTPAQVGLWLGTWGMLASLAGSTAGGLLATRRGLIESVVWTSTCRSIPMALMWVQTAGLMPVNGTTVTAVNCTEHFFGGALTTAMFALMMSRVDKRIGGTHYTLLASVEVAGKSLTSVSSGVLADRVGYAALFAGAVLVSLLFPLLAIPLKRALPPRSVDAAGAARTA